MEGKGDREDGRTFYNFVSFALEQRCYTYIPCVDSDFAIVAQTIER